MASPPHKCSTYCRCPHHGTPLLYWPAGDDHACLAVGCEYEQGFKPIEPPDPRKVSLDNQAALMLRYHPDLKNLGVAE
ncbi:hypothetical protein ACFVZH_20860 [Streptomyces sp. NPDC059534]|uniref:hypothetical protein n=1 Tax=Streptomyces sp. NPDC059534 TaxID=3346859 RepID=UPI0036D01B52